MKKAYTKLNTTLFKRPATANISNNNNNGTIVLAIYITNDAIRAIQN